MIWLLSCEDPCCIAHVHASRLQDVADDRCYRDHYPRDYADPQLLLLATTGLRTGTAKLELQISLASGEVSCVTPRDIVIGSCRARETGVGSPIYVLHGRPINPERTVFLSTSAGEGIWL